MKKWFLFAGKVIIGTLLAPFALIVALMCQSVILWFRFRDWLIVAGLRGLVGILFWIAKQKGEGNGKG